MVTTRTPATNGTHVLDENVPDLIEAGPPEAIRLPLDEIDASPNNPRRTLPEVAELADSIAEFSLLQPIMVRRVGERYQVLSGHRRLAAYHMLREREPYEVRWRTIPAVIRSGDDEQAYLLLLTAQVHIANWRPREQAAALERLALSGMTLGEIGDKLHRTRGWVSKRLRVFADATLSAYVQSGRLAPSIAEELLPVLDLETKRRLAEQAAAKGWSQDQIKGQVRSLRLDRQLGQVGKLARELSDILSAVDRTQIPMTVQRDLMVLLGRLELISGKRSEKVPTIEAAQKAAGVKSQTRPLRRGEKKQPALKFRGQ